MKKLHALLLASAVCFDLSAGSPASRSPAMDLALSLNEAFASAADSASRSVVVINVITRNPVSLRLRDPELDAESLPSEPRHQREGSRSYSDGGGRKGGQASTAQPLSYDSQGSGVILREDGYILTNRHVVDDAQYIHVRLADGREYSGELRGVDALSDLAVVKIEACDLKVATLGNSDRTRVGEFAIAIGAPFELERTVTFGHLSAKGRDGVLEDRRLDQDYLQTDAQINPGNSGGPLVNISGEVIGINTLVRGVRTGIGFAIPVNHAQRVADQLIRNGRYSRSWIGIAVQPVNETPQLKSMFPETEQGLVVKQIDRTGPAGGTDLKPGDIIVSIDGHPTFKPRDLRDAIRAREPGTVVQICIDRGGKLTTIKLKTEEMPVEGEGRQTRDSREDAGEPGQEEFFGLRMEVVPEELAKREGLDRRQGVLISDVRAGSVAEQCGIRPGSVLTEINRKPVTHPKQAREILRTLSKAPSVAVSIVKSGQASFEILQAPGL